MPQRSSLAAIILVVHFHQLCSRWQRNGEQQQELDCLELHSTWPRRRAQECWIAEPSVRCCGPLRWSLLMGVSQYHVPSRAGDGSCDAEGRSDDARRVAGPSRNKSFHDTHPCKI